MAAPSAGDTSVTRQLWDETLTRLLNLSDSTLQRNAELEARVAHLELELSVWKQAHSAALDTAERESTAHNAAVTALNRQMASLQAAQAANNINPLILCVIDSFDGYFFNSSLLVQGYQGGRLAGQQIARYVAEYLPSEEVKVLGRASFWVTVYYNKSGLLELVNDRQLCTAEQLESFLLGFTQASPRFTLIDVGPAKDVAFAKIKDYLRTFSALPQTLRVFFGGAYDMTHMAILSELQNESLLGKIRLLQCMDGTPLDINKFGLPRVQFGGLLVSHKSPKTPPPISLPIMTARGTVTVGGLVSPQSPPRATLQTSGPRLIDPSKPLHRQEPPPCNEYYLMTCNKGTACKYSHEYLLTPDQLATLAANAKKAPCNAIKRGLECPAGDQCCWGHVCPNGIRCFHLSKGKCWFKGEGMHPPDL
ncbi:hypothetical protein PUNSTDRAFT_51197 [Punctularia strigosozonata HHB-11173 SS5]|uniref:uncharacterized protein n=1 Tax=Punctularia strigosozonata (strain HHB-11173) TaxID=741275 RepID=UPI00044170C6|nr:uncharacterized protein PUNSTDRAFT_51197 [Punctularia strigosozonata HHB-11173 SS5]EIN10581.1 hypothetical protein PUNSTDRAFT_51197 [Punctularia strigosozonata HHB-11173 SS5]